ncbi:enoyl-CoA hydratase/isomerase family protein [Spongiibacter nanhainus]|uniref:Enoyl-CoA hydratase/isomerase family protein n=1 Tax=Spongiibacter nanhainus TaxID=2794344 RepID=A0A7T4UQK6_9GAMM|nr:enoyl-CoA hydratase/isomerase family protein [Spongiibacter nanhainus]QQD18577.1 enoyl-CoA hydratase/isomerase family protein [Spongiibacter nanhainus]
MISFQSKNGVGLIQIDDPPTKNSLSESMAEAMLEVLLEVESDSSVQVLVITALGEVFCSGGNVKDFTSFPGDRGGYVGGMMERVYNPLVSRLRALPMPTIVALNGPAIGAGVGLALNADFVFADEESYFHLPFVPKFAIVPDFGSGWLLVRAIGYSKALALCLNGERISAAKAMEMGLVQQVCKPGAALSDALFLAEQICRCAGTATLRTKELLRQAEHMEIDDYLSFEKKLQAESFNSRSFDEAIAAFKGRRVPDFRGM